MGDTKTVTMYYKALINPFLPYRYKRYNILTRFLKTHYPHIIDYIHKHVLDNTCPVCKRKFPTRYALYSHLSKTHCGSTLQSLARMLKRHVPEDHLLNLYSIEIGGETHDIVSG